jgi:N-acetylmuramoyl-L-alanine amidase
LTHHDITSRLSQPSRTHRLAHLNLPVQFSWGTNNFSWLFWGPLFFLALGLLFCLQSEALADGELARARQAREVFLADVHNHQRADWLALVKQFEHAADVQPKREHAAKGRFLAAELLMLSFDRFDIPADAVRAGDLAKRVVKGCSRCPDAPAAQIIVGLSLIVQKKPEEAYRELMKVGLNYRGTPEVAQAETLMASLSGSKRPTQASSPDQSKGTAQNKGPDKNASGQAGGSANADQASNSTPSQTSPSKSTSKPPEPTPPPARSAPKAPTPRADGRNQFYALYLDDRGTHTEVTAYSERVVPYLYNLLPPSREGGRFRVYVDFKDTILAPGSPSNLKNTTPLVNLVKVSQLNGDTVRLVADLPDAYPYMPVFLDQPPRMIIRVAKESNLFPPTEPEAPPTPRPTPTTAIKPVKGPADSMARQLGLTVRRVVIDPGHGGKDGGAAAHGLKEKDIVLKVALDLKKKIEEQLGLEVVLTRDTDRFVTLDRRTKISKDEKADIFISIHANANLVAKVEGFETYVLNFTTDPAAVAVASRENSSSGKSMNEIQNLVTKIARNTKVAESRVLAKALHSGALASLSTSHKVRDLGVKEAAFVVLAYVEVPAVLLEIGFITNKDESAKINDKDYQDLLTDGLVNGLKAYLEGLP